METATQSSSSFTTIFFFNDTATTEIYTLSLHDALPILEAFGDTGGVSASTINGSLTAELPAQLDAEVDAKTVNGSITTDYPLTVNGKFMGRNVKGTLGRGGRNVHLETVNGSIRMKKVV